MTDGEDTEMQQLASVDIDEGDPFEGVQLSVIDEGENSVEIGVATVDATPGRYVLIREELTER